MSLEAYGRSLCKVCNSKYRAIIDNVLADPKQSTASVLRYCEENFGEKFTRASLTTHRQKHMGEMVAPMPGQDIIAAAAVQEDINTRFDLGDVDVHDKVNVLSYIISKCNAFIRQLEKVHPMQQPHGHIQNYFKEIRECLKTIEGSGDGGAGVNVAIISMEATQVMRLVAETVREVIPAQAPQFMDRLKARVQAMDASIVDPSDPTKYVPHTSVALLDKNEEHEETCIGEVEMDEEEPQDE